MIVVDASALFEALATRSPVGDRAQQRLVAEDLAAPQLLHLELPYVIRKHRQRGSYDDARACRLVDELLDMPIRVFDLLPLLPRVWELRHNVTPYDAAYVALAEALDATLLTTDQRLAGAPGPTCRFEVLTD